MKRQTFVTVLALLFLGIALICSRAAAARDFRVEGAGLEADPVSYSGPCPGLITFRGKIQASGAGRVKYTYSYSDGGSGPEGFVDFDGPGVKRVETTWRLGDARVLPRFEGWAMLKITSPNAYESNKAKFVLECKQGGSQPSSPPQPPREQPQKPPPGERLSLAAPAQLAPENQLEPIRRQRVLPSKPDAIRLLPDKNFAGIFLVKFVEGSHVRYRDGKLTTGKDQINREEARRLARLNLSLEELLADLARVNDLVGAYGEKYGFTVSRTFRHERSLQDPEAQFREKERLEIDAGEELADLDLYYTIAARDFKNLPAQEKFMNELNRLRAIEFVQAAFLTEGASVRTHAAASPAPPQAGTPDL
jgi:hypothetical protein